MNLSNLRRLWKNLSFGQRFSIILLLCAVLLIPFSLWAIFNPVKLTNYAANRANMAPEEAAAKQGQKKIRSNEIYIKIKKNSLEKIRTQSDNNRTMLNLEDTGIKTLNTLAKDKEITSIEQVAYPAPNSLHNHDLFRWYKITLNRPQKQITGTFSPLSQTFQDTPDADYLQSKIRQISQDEAIEIAQPSFVVEPLAVPNDPYYSSFGSFGPQWPYNDLWNLHMINMEQAWDVTTGSPDVVVAVIDMGLDYNHPDLKDNVWENPGETGPDSQGKDKRSNGIDDDNNGYIDDWRGWNFDQSNNNPYPDAEGWHGTLCSGIIGAMGNNALGVTGMNWKVKIMHLKGLGSPRALQYAADNGARISSNSYNLEIEGSFSEDLVKYQHDRGMLTVVSAGNDNMNVTNNALSLAMTISATAWANPVDVKANYSNWGDSIDVAAPGSVILSTWASNDTVRPDYAQLGYGRGSGTSFSAPEVAGLAALLLAKNPSLTNEELRQIIRMGTDDLGAPGKDAEYGFGRINGGKTMALANFQPLTPLITSPRRLQSYSGRSITVSGSIGGKNLAKYKVELKGGSSIADWTLLAESAVLLQSENLGYIDMTSPAVTDGLYSVRLTAYDTDNRGYSFQTNAVIIDNIHVKIMDMAYDLPEKTEHLDIFGVAYTDPNWISGFNHYDLSLGTGEQPKDFKVFSTSSTSTKEETLLGNLDTSALSQGMYAVKLTAYDAAGKLDSFIRTFRIIPGPSPTPLPPTPTPFPAVVSKNGKIELSASGGVLIADPDGSHLQTLVNWSETKPFSASDATWSFDGKQIAFVASRFDSSKFKSYYKLMSKTYPEGISSTWLPEQAAGITISSPHFSPDGQTLFFSMSTAPDAYGNTRRGIYRVSKSNPNPVTIIPPHPNQGDYLLRDISTDGTKIMYYFTGNGWSDQNEDIFIANIDGTNPVDITNTPGIQELYASFSPDGKTIVFYKFNSANGTYDLYTMNIDGSGMKELVTSSDVNESNPCYSPDGTKIVYGFQSKTNSQTTGINLINADGSGKTKIMDLHNDLWLNMHCWVPDPLYTPPTPTITPTPSPAYQFSGQQTLTLRQGSDGYDGVRDLSIVATAHPDNKFCGQDTASIPQKDRQCLITADYYPINRALLGFDLTRLKKLQKIKIDSADLYLSMIKWDGKTNTNLEVISKPSLNR